MTRSARIGLRVLRVQESRRNLEYSWLHEKPFRAVALGGALSPLGSRARSISDACGGPEFRFGFDEFVGFEIRGERRAAVA